MQSLQNLIPRHVHFVGIGGIGMSGLARILLEMGYEISGSDLNDTKITQDLKLKGARIFYKHQRENIKGAGLVVISTAISSDNPEIQAARKSNVLTIQRAQLLGYLMNSKFGIAVTGTHGKTTTTSMIATILEYSGFDPTIIVGGNLSGSSLNAKLGKSKFIVAEADESDASFLKLDPRIAVITNIDTDINLNCSYFSSCNFKQETVLKKVTDSFMAFIERVPEDGGVFFCADCKNVREILSRIKRNYITYGFQDGVDFSAKGIKFKDYFSKSDIFFKGKFLGKLILKIPGRHNVLNSLASIAVCMSLGIDFKNITSALEKFKGVERRFQILGKKKGIMVVDDYAHNPSKIKAVLEGVKGGNRRIVAVFQPHRYTRTKLLLDEFRTCFDSADILIVTEIYSAGEMPINGINGKNLSRLIRKSNKKTSVVYLHGGDEILKYLKLNCKGGDLVITIGAGDIWQVGRCFYDSLN